VNVEDDFKLGDDTVRNLETLAHAPGEVRFRLGLVYALRDVRRQITSVEGHIVERIERAEKTIMGPGKVTGIVKSEMKGDPRVGKLETEVKRLWWIVGLMVALILGIAIAKAFK
jgi:hypothetical protein